MGRGAEWYSAWAARRGLGSATGANCCDSQSHNVPHKWNVNGGNVNGLHEKRREKDEARVVHTNVIN